MTNWQCRHILSICTKPLTNHSLSDSKQSPLTPLSFLRGLQWNLLDCVWIGNRSNKLAWVSLASPGLPQSVWRCASVFNPLQVGLAFCWVSIQSVFPETDMPSKQWHLQGFLIRYLNRLNWCFFNAKEQWFYPEPLTLSPRINLILSVTNKSLWQQVRSRI